jgi:hypothetical protein
LITKQGPHDLFLPGNGTDDIRDDKQTSHAMAKKQQSQKCKGFVWLKPQTAS